MVISPFILSGNCPVAPDSTSPKAPLIEVSGVRNSWLTVDRNSVFAFSATLRCDTSR